MAEQKQNPVVIVVLIIIIVGALLFNLKRTASRPAASPLPSGQPAPASRGGVLSEAPLPVSQKATSSGKKITAPGIKVKFKQLTATLAYDTQPAFSPDGREIAYASFSQGRQNIYILRLNSNEKPVALTQGDYLDSHPCWSPGGSTIIFSSNRQGKNGLYWVDKFTGEITPLNKEGTSPAISPDGEWLAFADQHNIWMMKLASKEFTPLTKSGYNDWPSWGKGGKEIYFSGGGFIKVYNTEGSEVRAITSSGFSDYPFVSPYDGRLVYISLESGAYDLWIMNPDGSKKLQVTADEAREYFPYWSPDGQAIVFASDSLGLSHLWLLTLPTE